jgi:hypothetical protein
MSVKQEPTKWGLNVDIFALVALAALTALAFIINASFPLPLPFGLTWTFGGAFVQIADVLLGPLWGGICAGVAIAPNALLLWGAPDVILGAFLDHFFVSLLNKRLPLVIAAPLALVIMFPYWMIVRLTINGYPILFALQIHVKAIIQFIVNALIATLILGVPGFGKYFPVRYESHASSVLLGKE